MSKLIIGSSGFIGSNLILNSKSKIICTYYLNKLIVSKKNIKKVKLNIFNQKSLNKIITNYKINEIINLVSNNNNITHKSTNNFLIWEKNTSSLVRLLENLRKKKKHLKVIHISSNETQEKNSTIYSLSKKTSEEICKVYRKNFNIKVSIIRIGNVIGFADQNKNRIVPYILNQILSNQKIKLKNPNKTINFSFADDVSKKILNFNSYHKLTHFIKPEFKTTPYKLSQILSKFENNKAIPMNKIEKKLYKIFIWYKKNF